MDAKLLNLILIAAVFIATIISIKWNITVAIVEIVIGVILANLFSISPPEWMTFLGGLGGIVLTFLAGAEVDVPLLKTKFKESLLIGGISFFAPFLGAYLVCFYLLHWTLNASLIAGCALSTTSLAVVYAVLVESGLTSTDLGKLIMASTFITDIGTALALSILFLEMSIWTAVFLVISVIVILIAIKAESFFMNPQFKNKVHEPELKLIMVFIFVLIFFAELGHSHAVLPVFILGLISSPVLKKHCTPQKDLRKTFRSVAYVLITPFFFIMGGLRVSLSLLWSALGIFILLFVVKMITKIGGIYSLCKKYTNPHQTYFTLLMSTGLTFGTISSVYGLEAGYIDQVQFSVLIAVVILSAVLPTIIAQKFFNPPLPKTEENCE